MTDPMEHLLVGLGAVWRAITASLILLNATVVTLHFARELGKDD